MKIKVITLAIFLFAAFSQVLVSKDVQQIKVEDLSQEDQRIILDRYHYITDVLSLHLKMKNKGDDLEKLNNLKLEDPEKATLKEMSDYFYVFTNRYFENYYSVKPEMIVVQIKDVEVESSIQDYDFNDPIGKSASFSGHHIQTIIRILSKS